VSASARHLMWNLLAHEWAPWGGLPRPHHGEGSFVPITGRSPSSPSRGRLPRPHHGVGSLVPITGRGSLVPIMGRGSFVPIMGRALSSPPRGGLSCPYHGQGSLILQVSLVLQVSSCR
jgi:hypothetical protein